MKLKATSNSNFEPHPEADCTAVCVDITPTKRVETAYGAREVFRIVFETDVLQGDGKPHLVWSRGFTPTLHEKSALRAFLKQWFGRDLNSRELSELDTESLIGLTAKLLIVHNESNGTVYANIGLIRPDRSPNPLKASGKYVRVQDREEKRDGQFRRAAQDDAADEEEQTDDSFWRRVKVHIGKNAGMDLGDLDEASVRALIERWLPGALANKKPLKADRELIAALKAAALVLGITIASDEDDNLIF
ncbi:MAG: hypothetical protein KGS60_19485 [Verrucomicrobia bacterium]|nr:hypothetical protein [Verrucomicrobiota bacterium]